MSIIAHRGFNDTYLENSVQAFQEAIRKKCKYLETDVRLTKDNVFVLFHDDTIEGKAIRSLTYAELTAIRHTDTLQSLMKIVTVNQVVLFDLKFTTKEEIELFLSYMIDNHYLPYQRQSRMKDILQVTTTLVKTLHECLVMRYAHTFYLSSWLPESDSDLEANLNLQEHAHILMHDYCYFLNNPDHAKKVQDISVYVYTVNQLEIIEKLKHLPNNLIKGIVTDKSKFLG